MFRGRYRHIVDAKGRLSIPSRFRDVIFGSYGDDRVFVTNFDECLWVYPPQEWYAMEAKIARLPQFKEEVKALQRVFISAAVECPIDKSGRILLPLTLREYAGISKEVVLVGMVKRIEIWSLERWNKVFEEAQDRLKECTDKLADLGL